MVLEGEGERINEGNTSSEVMYICEITNANLNIMFGEGEGVGREPGGSSPSTVCMYVPITVNYIMM